ncbi:hypothetical protein P8610_07940 [Fictibacillus sp. UD]|uniref:hypothetical protein n=1 Tax=Fictibacillus sp. UD TaxID=3038777 RepID=UPI0037467F9E
MKASVFASHLDDEVLGVGGANINHLKAKDIYVFVVIEGSSTEWETQAQNRFIPNVNLEITNQLKKKQKAISHYQFDLRPYTAASWGNLIGVEVAEPFMPIRDVNRKSSK